MHEIIFVLPYSNSIVVVEKILKIIGTWFWIKRKMPITNSFIVISDNDIWVKFDCNIS